MEHSGRFFLGITGDARATRGIITDESGDLLSVASDAPMTSQDAVARVREISRAALGQAGLRATSLTLAAVSLEAIHRPAPQELTLALPDVPMLAPDYALAALMGASAGREGVIVLADDDVMAYGRTPEGVEARAGGWGPAFSGEGGPLWVAMEGVRAALRAHDGRAPFTTLTGLLTERLPPAEDASGLPGALAAREAPISSLADVVVTAAEAGDNAAINVLSHAALHQANAAASVARALWTAEEAVGVYAVGPLGEQPFFLSHLETWLKQLAPRLMNRRAELPPVAGAALLALDAAGVPPDALDIARLSRAMDQALPDS